MDDFYTTADVCEWPTTVFLQIELDPNEGPGWESGLCTGAYVGNGMVVTAAHCLANSVDVSISFGEDGFSGEWLGPGLDCTYHPGAEWVFKTAGGFWSFQGPDIGFCLIDVDADFVDHPLPPKIPIMVPNGCETDFIRDKLFGNGPLGNEWALAPGTYVGMGNIEDGCIPPDCDPGTKRYADGDILHQAFSTNQKTQQITALQPDPLPGTGFAGVVLGDSGGPMNFAMYDNSRRLIGTISGKNDVAKLDLPPKDGQTVDRWAVYLTPTPLYLHWLEYSSGRDVSPCHTYNNTTNSWDFTGGSDCGLGYEASPLSGPNANWNTSSGKVSACGASDVLTTETACAGWSPWPTTPPWKAARPPKSNGDGLVEVAINGAATETFLEARGLAEIYGSPGDDRVTGSSAADEIFLGAGDDTVISAGGGDDQILCGSGNDEIYGGDGADVIYGDLGADQIHGEGGDDTIIILGECEIDPAEVYDGGSGTDTLVSPLTVTQLQNMGVTVQNFETVITTDADTQTAACERDPNITLIGMFHGR